MAEQANTSGISCETETPRRRHKEGGYHWSHRDQPGACWSCPRPKWSAPRRLCGSGPVGGRGIGRTLPALLVSIGQSGRSGRGERAELGVYWPAPGSSVRAGPGGCEAADSSDQVSCRGSGARRFSRLWFFRLPRSQCPSGAGAYEVRAGPPLRRQRGPTASPPQASSGRPPPITCHRPICASSAVRPPRGTGHPPPPSRGWLSHLQDGDGDTGPRDSSPVCVWRQAASLSTSGSSRRGRFVWCPPSRSLDRHPALLHLFSSART